MKETDAEVISVQEASTDAMPKTVSAVPAED